MHARAQRCDDERVARQRPEISVCLDSGVSVASAVAGGKQGAAEARRQEEASSSGGKRDLHGRLTPASGIKVHSAVVFGGRGWADRAQ